MRPHYRSTAARTDQLYRELGDLPQAGHEAQDLAAVTLDREKPTAVVLVASYGGVGIHTLLNVFRSFPGCYRQVVFVSVGVVDSGEFKGEHAVDDLRAAHAGNA